MFYCSHHWSIVISMEKIVKEYVQIDPSLLKEHVVENVTYRSTNDFHITVAEFEKARKELKETDEVRKSSLKSLREMLAKDKHIMYRMDDDYLLRFLRYRKFDIKKAYKFIRNFYTMRNDDPKLFTMPPDIHLKLKGEFANMMPYVNEDGMLLFIHKFGHWNPAETSVRELLNMFSYVSDVMTMNPHAQINGVIDIWDLGGTTASHLSAMMYPSALKLWTKFVQDVYPWRIKKVVLFNCHDLVYTGLTLTRYFLKRKLANRLVVLRSDLDELHKHINPAILPKEFGGCLDDDECYSYLRKTILNEMKLLWILVICLTVSYCSSEETLENDVFADEIKSVLESPSEEAAVAPMESQRSCKGYQEECDNDCECCNPNYHCHCFTLWFNCKCFGGSGSDQWSTCHKKNRECKLNTNCGKPPCTTKKCIG